MAVPSQGHGRAGNQVRAPERKSLIVSHRESGRRISGWRSPSWFRAAFLCVSLGGMDMKKKMGALILSFALLDMGCVFADEPSTTPEVDPEATQMTEAFPSPGCHPPASTCAAGERTPGGSCLSEICRRSRSVCEGLPALYRWSDE